MSLKSNIDKLKSLIPLTAAQKAKLDEVSQKNYELLSEMTEGFKDYEIFKESETFEKLLDAWLRSVQKHLDKKEKPKPTSSRPKKTRTGTSKPKTPTRRAKLVREINPAVRLIKRFASMHGKEKTKKTFRLLKNAIDRAMAKGEINGRSSYIKEVREVLAYLVDILSKIKSEEEPCKIVIPESKLHRYVQIAGGEQVFESVKLINAFISIQGRDDVRSRAERLLDRINAARKKKKVREGDPFFPELDKIKSSLNKYIQGKSTRVSISKNSLAGFAGTANEASAFSQFQEEQFRKFSHLEEEEPELNGFSSSLPQGESNNAFNIEAKPKNSVPRKGKGKMNVEDAKKIEIRGIGVKEPFKSLLGDFSQDSSMQVFGKGGQGKTTFLLLFSQYFADNHGSVAYVTSEEFGRGTFKQVLNRLGIRNGTKGPIDIVSGLEEINPSDYEMIIIDSKDNIGLHVQEYIELKEAHPNTFFVVVSQATKDGTFTGRKAWEHENDINVLIDSFIASTEGQKNRWGGASSLHFDYMGNILSPQTEFE